MQELLQQLVLGIAWGSVYALIALGYTMVYGVLRLINFAHGDVYMLGAFLAFYGITALHLPLLAAALLSMLGCSCFGLLMERCAYRPLRQQPRLAALITAIGISLFLEYGGQLFFGPNPKPFPQESFHGPVAHLLGRLSQALAQATGILIAREQLLVIFTALLLMALLNFVVYRTRAGTAIRAVAFDRDAASLMGINTDRTIAFTFFLGSALAAAAGVLVSLIQPQIDPIMDLMPGVKAFVAAVLGGIGNLVGAMLGGLLMGVAEYLVAGSKYSTLRDAIAFAILIIVLLLRPTGLTGKGVVEKV